MEYLIAVIIATIVLLDLPAIYVVAIEDLLYEPLQKFFKIIFILIVPIAGAITELYLLSRYAQYKESGGQNDAQWYEFWDHYSNASHSSHGNGTEDSSGYDGGGDGGSSGGD